MQQYLIHVLEESEEDHQHQQKELRYLISMVFEALNKKGVNIINKSFYRKLSHLAVNVGLAGPLDCQGQPSRPCSAGGDDKLGWVPADAVGQARAVSVNAVVV